MSKKQIKTTHTEVSLNIKEAKQFLKHIVNNGYKSGKIYVLCTKNFIDLKDIKNKGLDYILHNLDELGIALWIYDDGSISSGGTFLLHTNRYSYIDKGVIIFQVNRLFIFIT